MHAVEDSEGESDVHDRGPHGELVEVRLHAVVELRPGAKCRHDPELGREGGGGHTARCHQHLSPTAV